MSDATSAADLRARSFRTPGGPDVFHAIAHRHEIAKPDPFDVETIHEESRAAFRALVARAAMSPPPTSGRILLLMGESGSGKTHLMRAFRNWAHGGGRGYCGYMQMTSATDHYGRYVLSNLIDSLSQPYYEPFGDTTGLMRLSTALAESSRSVPRDRLIQLREDDLTPDCLARLIDALADQIVEDERFDACDLDLIRALLYLQRDDPRLRARVLKYLRCEDLSAADRAALGGLTPRLYGDAPERVVALLGQLMGSVEVAPLILCVDQLEDMYNLDDARGRFRRVIATVCDLADRVPSCVIVISCLEDFYLQIQEHLSAPARARVEQDPEPIRLVAGRDASEVAPLIAKRLEVFFDALDVPVDEGDPTHPIPPAALGALDALPARKILDWCRDYRKRCIEAGAIVPVGPVAAVAEAPSEPDPIRLEGLWNDARSGPVGAIPMDEPGLADLLAEAVRWCSEERPAGHPFAAEADGATVSIRPAAGPPLRVGVCNKAAQGGGLGRQVADLERQADGAIPVVVRSTEFPASPTAAVSRQLGQLVAKGGRRVVVQDADWRVMLAMKAFRSSRGDDPEFGAWLRSERPLSRLKSLRMILALDEARTVAPPAQAPPPAEPPRAGPVSPVPFHEGEQGPIRIGSTSGIHPLPVEIDPQDLIMHAAFLGASGSGKTTLALTIIEGLLLRGIPAVLIDRKGDLCRYADPAAWTGAAPDASIEARREALRERVEVAVFTPGEANGRPLSIAAVPPGLGTLATAEREQAALFAAGALGGMMNYKPSGPERTRSVILAKAIDLLSQARPQGVSLPELIEFIADADDTLVNAIGRLEPRHFAKLVEDLETLRHSRGYLLAAQGEPMDAEALLGLGPHASPGKTRLSIVSTRSLGQAQDIQFWVAQFLGEMARWSGRSPSKRLRAVLLFDEADLYLPALKQPPSKAPMENLLKRARSAGLGLMLATQSPGDFDYKCRENIRSWFVGRVQESTAIGKMKPMLSETRGDVANKLAGQTTGQFFFLREGQATAFRAERSAIATEQVPEAEIPALAARTRGARPSS